MAAHPVRRALNFLAKMGLTVRDDPRRVIDPAARAWGDPADGFALSIEQTPGGISVVLRNAAATPRTLIVPGWLAFYEIDIDAQPTPFGRELRRPGRQTERVTVTLQPGEMAETQIPLGSLFVLRPGADYRVHVSCALPGGATVSSNTIRLRAE